MPAFLGRVDPGASGTGLVIRSGDPSVVIPALAHELQVRTVFVTRDYAPYGRRRDAAVKSALEDLGVRLVGVGSPYAVPPGSVRKADGSPYAVFTPFSKAWRQTGWNAPDDPPGDDFAWRGAASSGPDEAIVTAASPRSEMFEAGERAADDRWEAFVRGGLDRYDQRRNFPAEQGTSLLSPALKWGTIHPRQLLACLDGSGSGERAHTVFSAELAWREFYADVLFHRPESAWHNLDERMNAMRVDTDTAARRRFDTWTAGETGFGIVDAGMRQLAATGWMHNRVRMITASFLVKDLHVPWQWGARWFMDHLDRRRPRLQQPRLAVGRRHGNRRRTVFPGVQPAAPAGAIRPRRRVRRPVGPATRRTDAGPRRRNAPRHCVRLADIA